MIIIVIMIIVIISIVMIIAMIIMINFFEISQSYFNVFSAVSYDEQNARVSVVYNDHSLYIWDVRDIRKVGVFGFPSYYQTIETCIFRLASLIPSSSIPLASGDLKSTRPPWEMARKQ